MTGPAVRVLGADDVDRYRTARLNGLRLEPTAFGSSHEIEASMPDSFWASRVAPEGGDVVGVFVDGELVSTGALIPDTAVEGGCMLVGMWTEPAHRSRGHGSSVIDAVLQCGVARGYSVISCSVTVGNDRAGDLYRRHGFVVSGEPETRASDGSTTLHMSRPL